LTNLVEHQIHLKPLYNTAQTLSTLGDIWSKLALQLNINKMSMSIFFNKNRKFCIKN
jgi:hypothetical protein